MKVLKITGWLIIIAGIILAISPLYVEEFWTEMSYGNVSREMFKYAALSGMMIAFGFFILFQIFMNKVEK